MKYCLLTFFLVLNLLNAQTITDNPYVQHLQSLLDSGKRDTSVESIGRWFNGLEEIEQDQVLQYFLVFNDLEVKAKNPYNYIELFTSFHPESIKILNGQGAYMYNYLIVTKELGVINAEIRASLHTSQAAFQEKSRSIINMSENNWTISLNKYISRSEEIDNKCFPLTTLNRIDNKNDGDIYVLFVIDNSGSMDDYQNQLVRHIDNFASSIDLLVDPEGKRKTYFGISTTDSRNKLGFTQIEKDSNYDGARLSRKAKVGTNGSGDELSIASAADYMADNNTNIRPSDYLIVMNLSDEELQTRNGLTTDLLNLQSNSRLSKDHILFYNIVNGGSYNAIRSSGFFSKNVPLNSNFNLKTIIDDLKNSAVSSVIFDLNKYFDLEGREEVKIKYIKTNTQHGSTITLSPYQYTYDPESNRLILTGIKNNVQSFDVKLDLGCF